MLHDPEVLILDEPTSGLDPNQLIDIRNLIKELGKSKTVIFSTHIMQEVEALCDRVIIINKGNIVADDTVGMLQKRSTNETVITVEFSAAAALSSIEGIEGVSGVEALGNHRFKIKSSSETDIRPAIFEFAVRHKLVLLEMHREIFSIEDVFQALTKRLEN
jgi:ABC-2 type transport system ATP-binding protein